MSRLIVVSNRVSLPRETGGGSVGGGSPPVGGSSTPSKTLPCWMISPLASREELSPVKSLSARTATAPVLLTRNAAPDL